MKVNAVAIATMMTSSNISGAVEGTKVLLFPDGEGGKQTILFPRAGNVIVFPTK